MLLAYLRDLIEQERRGDAREESHYPALKTLLERAAAAGGRPDVRVTVMPQRTPAGDVDFQVWGARGRLVGYVEAKRPGTDLTQVAGSEQVKRYLEAFGNVLLTNFHQFRLYRSGSPAGEAAIDGPPWLAAYADRLAAVEGEAALLALLGRFFDFSTPRTLGAAALATHLARRTRLLAEAIVRLLADGRSAELAGLFAASCEYLIRGLTHREFADLYAQTIAYGLLAARFQEDAGFDRRALAEVPRGNGLLRDLFRYLSLAELRPEVAWIVDDLVDLLREAPVARILGRYFRKNRGKDPIHHFYETFLAVYDRELRRGRGVYYTPPELVSYLVRSVQRLLVERFGWRDGFADRRVRLLDPAAGTLTFVIEALRAAIAACRAAHGGGAVPALIREHLLVHAYAFEVMMAPYAMGHLKLHLALAEEGYPLADGARFPLYLTNALDHREMVQSNLPGTSALSREAHAAGVIKRDERVNVVLGNPPYSGHSYNHFDDVDAWLKTGYLAGDAFNEGYYRVDGRLLGERNPKWLQDDYVKFLRFAQRKIDLNGEGIVAFVTNHGYLDNPTFRGMRRSLLRTFDEIYVLDLHGNREKGKAAPGAERDENVFEDVDQGVAIALLVKKPGLARRVVRADLHGSHQKKLDWLADHDLADTGWTEIAPRAPAYLFVAEDAEHEPAYRRGVPLPEIFPVHSAAVVTARDAYVVGFHPGELAARLDAFRSYGALSPEDAGRPVLEDKGSFRVAAAREELLRDADWRARLLPLLYRPFDGRTIFYADYLVERPRRAVMDHMLAGPNFGLVCPKQHKEDWGALLTDRLAAHKAVSAYDVNDLFPLYLYPRRREETGVIAGVLEGRRANVAPALAAALGEAYGLAPPPEELLSYVYAVLYSPPYRRRYRDQLRRAFPRVPFPRDVAVFARMAALGTRLAALHLLPPRLPGPPGVRFEGRGSGRVGAAKRSARDYRPAEGRVYVNGDGQHFDHVAPEVWAYRIGGYQVLDRWLASRAGRELSLAEIEGFAAAAAAIGETLALEPRLVDLYPEVEAVPLLLPGSG